MNTPRPILAAAATVATLFLVVGISSPASAALPVPSTVMTCTKLASATNPAASFPVPISQRYASLNEERAYGGIPDSNFIEMAGGIACEYSNNIQVDVGTAHHAVGVLVEFLPSAASGYRRLFGATAGPDDFYCNDEVAGGCIYNSSVGGDWLEVEVEGARSDAVAESLSRRISTALQLGLKTPYVVPTYPNALPRNCSALISATQWRAAVGSWSPLIALGGPEWSPSDSARQMSHGTYCAMENAAEDHGAGQLEALPGGRWAFALVRSELTTPGPLTPITVPAMRTGDVAYTRCDAAHHHCILDALIATHWVEVDLFSNRYGSDLIRTDRLVASRTLLTDIVQHIYP